MSDLLVDIQDNIATLTFNRPEARNALSLEMRALLRDALHVVEQDRRVRCVLLRGAGGHFMAGGDVKSMSTMIDETPERIRSTFVNRIHDLHPIMFAMRRMPKPVVASVEGAAAGAGVSMALACDLVIAEENAFFTLAYCHIGTSPDGWARSICRARSIKRRWRSRCSASRRHRRAMPAPINFIAPAGTWPLPPKRCPAPRRRSLCLRQHQAPALSFTRERIQRSCDGSRTVRGLRRAARLPRGVTAFVEARFSPANERRRSRTWTAPNRGR